MKKVYALIGLVTFGLSAMAAPQFEMSQVNEIATLSNTAAVQTQTGKMKLTRVNGPAKEVSSIDDMVGIYNFSYDGILSFGDERQGEHTVAVYCAKENATTLKIGTYKSWYMLLTVNMARKTATLANKSDAGMNGTNPIYNYTYSGYTVGDDHKVKGTSVNRLVANITEDGSIEFDQAAVLGVCGADGDANGWYFFANSLGYVKGSYNTPIEADYEAIDGTGTFNDGWFNPLIEAQGGEGIYNTSVTYYRNKTNANKIAMKNPYGTQAWEETFGFDTTKTGWLLLDIEDPDWVQVVPLVVACTAVENDGSTEDYLPWNEEGMLVYTDGDVEGQKEEWASVGEDISNLDGDLISIYHGWFGITTAPLGSYNWNSAAGPYNATAVLPAGWSGISNVAVDANESVRYFNLQGLEVSNPANGELVIVKKGGKTYKKIAR